MVLCFNDGLSQITPWFYWVETMTICKVMKACAIIFVALTVLFTVLYFTCSFPISLAITFGTFPYHFCMRLLVGEVFNLVIKNRVNYNRSYYFRARCVLRSSVRINAAF